MTSPQLVDFAPRRIAYAGSIDGAWFASARFEPHVVALDDAGCVIAQHACPPVNRVIAVRDTWIGLAWIYAWGRRWGYNKSGEREAATGYDVRSGRTIWQLDGGVSGVLGEPAVGREDVRSDVHHVFDVGSGERRWSFRAYEPVVAGGPDALYVLDRDSAISAFDLATGTPRWRYEPPQERRVRGHLCRALAVTPSGVYYVCHPTEEHAVLTCLANGEPVGERAFDGWVSHVAAVGDRLVLHHEDGLAIASASSDDEIELVQPPVHDADCHLDRHGAALVRKQQLVMMPATTTVAHEVALEREWPTVHVDRGIAILGDDSRVLRWPLAFRTQGTVHARVIRPERPSATREPATVVFAGPALVLVQHATRGRFTLHAAGTGLGKGDAVEIGGFAAGPVGSMIATELAYTTAGVARSHRAGGSTEQLVDVGTTKVRRQPVSAAGRKLVEALVANALIAPLTKTAIAKLARHVDPFDPAETARLLQQVHGTDGLAFGFLAHDWRFGQETDDVIAEFARCLTGEPISLRQVATRPNALCIRTSRGNITSDDWVDVSDHGLLAVARFINLQLDLTTASRRVFSLETDGDWEAFLIRTNDEILALRHAGVPGIGRVDG